MLSKLKMVKIRRGCTECVNPQTVAFTFAVLPPGQMVEQALAKELLSSATSPNLSYLYYLAQFQLLRGNYPSATAKLKEVLVHCNQVLAAPAVALPS